MLAVDPGLRHCGVALFDGRGMLVGAWDVVRAKVGDYDRDADAWARTARAVWESVPEEYRDAITDVVVEMMEIREETAPRYQVDDLMQLVGVAGAIIGRFPDAVARAVRPTTMHSRHAVIKGWKGSIPKPKHHLKLLRNLSEAEQARLGFDVERYKEGCRGTRADGWKGEVGDENNLMDAVGLGLWGLGRWSSC